MKRPYEVQATITLYVLAKDEKEAERLGAYNLTEEAVNADLMISPVNFPQAVSPDWQNGILYGDNPDELTVVSAFAAYQEQLELTQ